MSVNARTICTDALQDLGIIGVNDTPTASELSLTFRRLNAMLAGWQTQSLLVPAIQRMVLPVVANKQTYTIGPGADYNMPRPVRVSGAGLLLAGFGSPQSVTSITSSSYTATVTLTAHGLSIGDEVLIDGATQFAYNGVQTVETVPTVDTFTYTLDEIGTSPATGTLIAYTVSATGVEIPRAVITDDAYEAIQLKRLSNTLFSVVYYNPTASPYGQIVLWPNPTTASNQLVLYVPQVFASFADYDTNYGWPLTPGYQEALQYNLERRLIGLFPVSDPVVIQNAVGLARETMALIKRSNYKLTDLPLDPALTRSYQSGYNINTGTGGGATS